MLDTQLRARLIKLGMPASKASRTTALIRDRVHPVAVVALSKMQDHRRGAQGMSGYEYDEMAGLFKKALRRVKAPLSLARKAVALAPRPGNVLMMARTPADILSDVGMGKLNLKKAIKKIGKELKPKNLLHEATHPLSHIKRSTRLSAPVLRVAAPIVTAINPLIGAAVTAGAVAGTALEQQRKKKKLKAQLSQALAEGGTVPVPPVVTTEAEAVAADAINREEPIDTLSLMQQLLKQQGGGSLTSPEAQQLLSDVAAEGVETTTAGPSSLPSWLLPAAAAVFGLAIVLPHRGKGRR